MKLEFKPEDFLYIMSENGRGRAVVASERANAKLREWLDAAPVLVGKPHDHMNFYHGARGDETHTARLVEIEEL